MSRNGDDVKQIGKIENGNVLLVSILCSWCMASGRVGEEGICEQL